MVSHRVVFRPFPLSLKVCLTRGRSRCARLSCSSGGAHTCPFVSCSVCLFRAGFLLPTHMHFLRFGFVFKTLSSLPTSISLPFPSKTIHANSLRVQPCHPFHKKHATCTCAPSFYHNHTLRRRRWRRTALAVTLSASHSVSGKPFLPFGNDRGDDPRGERCCWCSGKRSSGLLGRCFARRVSSRGEGRRASRRQPLLCP